MRKTTIILCKNSNSAKLLFERYCDLCRKAGQNAIVDKKRLALQFGDDSVLRFISAISYYNVVCHGNDAATIIGDEEFSSRMRELEKRGAKKTKGGLR